MSHWFGSTSFYFVRHGVTAYNLARRIMGQTDIPLTDQGRRQAEMVGQTLRGHGICCVLASPLSRAAETAEIVAGLLGVEVRLVPGLMERKWGVMEGRAPTLLPREGVPFGAESPEEFTARTLTALHAEAAAPPVLVVAHSGTGRVLRRHFGIDDGEAPMPNALPVRFDPLSGGAWRMTRLRGRE